MQKEKPKGSVVPSILLGSTVSLVLAALILLGLSFFVLRGGSANSLLVGGCSAICVLIGGRIAIRKGSGSVFLTGILTAGIVCIVMLTARFVLGNTWAVSPSFLSILLLILAGGCMAGLFGRRKRK